MIQIKTINSKVLIQVIMQHNMAGCHHSRLEYLKHSL